MVFRFFVSKMLKLEYSGRSRKGKGKSGVVEEKVEKDRNTTVVEIIQKKINSE